MCLIALALDAHPRFPLVIAANRDEFEARPSAPPQAWPACEGQGPWFGGRDLQAGGSWMALDARGRLALLTNVRHPAARGGGGPSRGALPLAWLAQPAATPAEALAHLGGPDCAGFNLLIGQIEWNGVDLAQQWAWRQAGRGAPGGQGLLRPGLHGLSNAALDTPWPKLLGLRAALGTALGRSPSAAPDPAGEPLQACRALADAGPDAGEALAAALFTALADTRPAPPASWPETGVGPAWERALSPAFIHHPAAGYGTRSSSVLLLERRAAGPWLRLWTREHPPGQPEAAAALAGARWHLAEGPWPGALPTVHPLSQAPRGA